MRPTFGCMVGGLRPGNPREVGMVGGQRRVEDNPPYLWVHGGARPSRQAAGGWNGGRAAGGGGQCALPLGAWWEASAPAIRGRLGWWAGGGGLRTIRPTFGCMVGRVRPGKPRECGTVGG